MEIFLSWSGERSKLFATALHDWFPKVIQCLNPWISSSDIDKGEQWLSKLSDRLRDNKFGIICLTSENLNAPWVLFEAGALSSAIDKANVCPVLFDFTASQLKGPLSQFQATIFSEADMLALLKTINKKNEGQRLSDEQLTETFNVWWPKLEDKVKNIAQSPTNKPERSEKDMVEEILMLTRSFSKDYFRQEWEWNLNIGIRKILTCLTPREEKIIRMHHGIQERKDFSVSEIAESFQISQKQVNSLIKSAYTKLSKYNIIEILKQN